MMKESDSESVLKTEKVFEILSEGGGLCISRLKNKLVEKFIYHHNEFDPTEENPDINNKDVYDNFEQAFSIINNKYPWYLLYLSVVDDNYRNYIIEKLIKKLNKEIVTPDNIENNKEFLENVLKIKLNYSIHKLKNKLTWSYEKIEQA
ncbi:MAG: hypothetical protein ACOYMA_18915 [Bacteroidia bacterium]